MKTPTNCGHALAKAMLALAGSTLLLPAAGPAAAASASVSVTASGPGGGTLDDEDGSHAEAVVTGELTMAGAVIDLPSGTLRGHALSSRRYQYAQALGLAFDVFTLWGFPLGTEVDLPVLLHIEGSMDAAMSEFGELSYALAWADHHHSDSPEWGDEKLFVRTLESYDFDPPAEHIDAWLPRTYRMTVGVPFGISYELVAKAGGVGAVDFSSTAWLSFDLPPGTSVSSEAGYFQSAVPEPALPAMMGAGLLVLIFLRRRRAGSAG